MYEVMAGAALGTWSPSRCSRRWPRDGRRKETGLGVNAEWRRLVEAAKEARERAYAPYSRFKVGAALLGDERPDLHRLQRGECGRTAPGWCAERTAVGAAIAGGERSFTAIAVVADTGGPCAPCGICRQVLAEFGQEIAVLWRISDGDVEVRRRARALARISGRRRSRRRELNGMPTGKGSEEKAFDSGFCAVVAGPNVGKSTLLNRVIGQKVTIVSDKPQTTRNKIQCVWTTENAQIIFLDTPGIHKPHDRLGERMVETAQEALDEVDVVLFMVDGAAGPDRATGEVADGLARVSSPVLLVVNKMDLVRRGERRAGGRTLFGAGFLRGHASHFGRDGRGDGGAARSAHPAAARGAQVLSGRLDQRSSGAVRRR